MIDINQIKPPFQARKFSRQDRERQLARIMLWEGLFEPIVVPSNDGHFEIIAGGRRVEAIRKYTGIKKISARIVNADDLRARRISAAENLVRESLSAIETIEAIVEIVDVELIKDKEYYAMGKNPADA